MFQVESLKVELSESTKYQEKYTACFEELNSLKENYSKAASMNRYDHKLRCTCEVLLFSAACNFVWPLQLANS